MAGLAWQSPLPGAPKAGGLGQRQLRSGTIWGLVTRQRMIFLGQEPHSPGCRWGLHLAGKDLEEAGEENVAI